MNYLCQPAVGWLVGPVYDFSTYLDVLYVWSKQHKSNWYCGTIWWTLVLELVLEVATAIAVTGLNRFGWIELDHVNVLNMWSNNMIGPTCNFDDENPSVQFWIINGLKKIDQALPSLIFAQSGRPVFWLDWMEGKHP